MKIQVILLLGVCAAVAWGTKGGGGGYGGYGGGGGKGKGKGGDDYGHIDFGPPRYTYQPVTNYREVQVKRPVTVYRPVTVKQPYTTYKKVLQPPPPKLIKKPVVTHVQEWRQVQVPKVTYQQVWVHPYYEEEKKAEKGCWFCGKGKGSKGKDQQVYHPQPAPYHPAPHHPQPAPYHPPAPAYGAPAKGKGHPHPAPAPYHPPQPTKGKGHH